jgi:hypothetical protein
MAIDLEQVLYQLNRKLHSLGVQYVGDDPEAAAELLKTVQAERAGKPPCYSRSFVHDDLTCRQCEEFRSCCSSVVYPKFTTEVPDQGLVSCEWCDGDFTVELFEDSGKVIDFGCSTDGCRNTWRRQKRAES